MSCICSLEIDFRPLISKLPVQDRCHLCCKLGCGGSQVGIGRFCVGRLHDRFGGCEGRLM